MVTMAQKQAQEIMDQATNDANEIRYGAIAYADSMLKAIEDLLEGSQSIFKTNFAQLSSSMQKTLEIVSANRAELAPSEIFQDAAEEQVLEADMMPQLYGMEIRVKKCRLQAVRLRMLSPGGIPGKSAWKSRFP